MSAIGAEVQMGAMMTVICKWETGAEAWEIDAKKPTGAGAVRKANGA